MKKILIYLLLLMVDMQLIAQERLWISDKSSIILRDDLNGFEKINDSTYQMIGIDEPCIEEDSSKSIIIDGVGTFSSMPCFRDYLLTQPNKIIVWGKLYLISDSDTIYNWENTKLNYTGDWSGRMTSGTPKLNSNGEILQPGTDEGCNCSYSNEAGAKINYGFTVEDSSKIIINSEKLNTHGKAELSVAGQSKVIDFYKDSLEFVSIEFVVPPGDHVLEITVLGESNPASSNSYFVLHNIMIQSIGGGVGQNPISEEPVNEDVLISQHNDMINAIEKVIGKDITRKGHYQVWQTPEGKKYIKQPNIEIE